MEKLNINKTISLLKETHDNDSNYRREHIFYDNEGNLRVEEGECMTDNAMLNEFDWYVEGVVNDEE